MALEQAARANVTRAIGRRDTMTTCGTARTIAADCNQLAPRAGHPRWRRDPEGLLQPVCGAGNVRYQSTRSHLMY